jgi:hypothetical protein
MLSIWCIFIIISSKKKSEMRFATYFWIQYDLSWNILWTGFWFFLLFHFCLNKNFLIWKEYLQVFVDHKFSFLKVVFFFFNFIFCLFRLTNLFVLGQKPIQILIVTHTLKLRSLLMLTRSLIQTQTQIRAQTLKLIPLPMSEQKMRQTLMPLFILTSIPMPV